MINLFDWDGKTIKPSMHCESIQYLKEIKTRYKKDYLDVYLFLHYMCCIDEKENPYVLVNEFIKKKKIVDEIGAKFDYNDEFIDECIKKTEQLYETPGYRTFKLFKSNLDKIAVFLEKQTGLNDTEMDIEQILKLSASYEKAVVTFEKAYTDVRANIATVGRGNEKIAYDQR